MLEIIDDDATFHLNAMNASVRYFSTCLGVCLESIEQKFR